MCETTVAGAIIDYQANLPEAVSATGQILRKERIIDLEHEPDRDDVRGLHRALDHHSDRWAKEGIKPPNGFDGQYIHRLKVHLRSFMLENKIEPAEKPEVA